MNASIIYILWCYIKKYKHDKQYLFIKDILFMSDQETKQVENVPQKQETEEKKQTGKFLLFESENSPLKNASEAIKELITCVGDNEFSVKEIKNPFEIKTTKVNCCSHSFNENGEDYYTCNDCCFNENYNIMCYCKDCFNFKKHQGHSYRIQTAYSESSFCDCGRRDRMKKQSFCDNHSEDKIQVEIPEEEKKKFAQFFSIFFKIAIYAQEQHQKNYECGLHKVFNEIDTNLIKILQILVKNSVYYTRMLMEVFKEEIVYKDEKSTLLKLVMRLFKGNKLFSKMSTDFQSIKELGKSYIELRKAGSVDSYKFPIFNSQITSNYNVLQYLASSDVFVHSQDIQIKNYLRFAKKQGQEGQKLFNKFVESQLKSSEQDLQYCFSQCWQNQQYEQLWPLFDLKLEVKLIQYFIKKVLAGTEPQKEQQKQEQEQQNKQQSKENKEEEAKDQTKQQVKEQAKEQVKEQAKEQAKGQIKQQIKENIQENNKKKQQQQASNQDCFDEDYQKTKMITNIVTRLGHICKYDLKRLRNIRKQFQFSSPDLIDKFLLYAIKYFCQYSLEERKILTQPFMVIMSFESQKKDEILSNLWSRLFQKFNHDFQEICGYCLQNISVVGQMPGYLNKEKVKLEKDPEIIKQCVEEQRKWFESLLYERKEIEVSDIWNKKEYGWLDFEGAGKIIKQNTIYTEELENFIFTSSKEFPNSIMKIPYRTYLGNNYALFSFVFNIESEYYVENYWQKEILREMFMNKKFMKKIKKQWESAIKQNYDNEYWKQNKVGYLYVLLLIYGSKITSGQNKEIEEELIKLKEKQNYRATFGKFADEGTLENLLCIKKNKEEEKKNQEKDKKKSEEAKKKAAQKKLKMKEKFKNTQKNILQKYPSKCESVVANEEQQEEEICLLCHEKAKNDNQLVYLSSVSKNTICQAIYGEDNKSGTLIYCCFHAVHINCYAKMQNGLQFNCPLCSKSVNCIFPVKFDNKNHKLNRMCSNIMIATMVSIYKILDIQNNFILLFKHLLESKGLNSVVSITRYEQQKILRNKVDDYLQILLKEIYKFGTEEQIQEYNKTIENLLTQVRNCKNKNIGLLQQVMIKAMFSYVKEEQVVIDEEILKKLQSNIEQEQYLIIEKELEQLAPEPIVLDEEQMSQHKQKASISFNLPKLPADSLHFYELGTNQCHECKKNGKKSWLCFLCNSTICQECVNNEKHYKTHGQNRLYFEFNCAYLYTQTVFINEGDCIYINPFQMRYDQNLKGPYDLDEQKLEKLMNKFMSS